MRSRLGGRRLPWRAHRAPPLPELTEPRFGHFRHCLARTVVGSRDPDPPAVSDEAKAHYARTIRAWLELEEEHERREMLPRPLPLADDAWGTGSSPLPWASIIDAAVLVGLLE